MPANLVYRTSNLSEWGSGQGFNLSAAQVDQNFWILWSAVETLQNSQQTLAGIDFISQPTGGNQFYVHLTNHAVLGPFTIPTSQWNPRGNWQPGTGYNVFDTVANNGQLYLVMIAHTSAATFSPVATDGSGHLLYVLILSAPNNALPSNGVPGQRLVKSTNSPYATKWEYDLIRMFVFVQGQPLASELLLQYTCVDNMLIPAGLAGSVVFNNTDPVGTVVFALAKNGISIGSITFQPSPDSTVSFPSAVACVPGDIITLTAPVTPDTNQADISFTIVAQLTS